MNIPKRLLLIITQLFMGLFLALWAEQSVAALVPPQVVAVFPAPESHDTEVTTPISITYDQDMNPITVNPNSFVVHARQTGLLFDIPEVEGGIITVQPDNPLHAGELVQVSATTQTLSMDGEGPLKPTVWQFTTAPWGGNAFFHEKQVLQSGDSRDAVLGDLDSDGDLDALTTSCFDGITKVYHNDGNGWFTVAQTIYHYTCLTDAELGDLNGDGYLDALLIDYWSTGNKVLWNTGDGTFEDSGQNIFSSSDSYAELGDLDGDGDLDFLVTSDAYGPGLLRVWKNDGNGIFSFFYDFDTAYKHMGVALGDLDGDADLDAFTTGWDNTYNKVWLNDGTGIFSEAQSIPNANTISVQLGDLDSDGDLDAYMSNMTSYDNTDLPDEVWFNDGTGNFTDSSQRLETVFSGFPALGDLDADGDLDVYLSGSGFAPAADEVWANDGAGNFTLFRAVNENYPGGFASLGDLDGDGNLDAFTASQDASYSFQVYLNGDWTQAESLINETAAYAFAHCQDDPDSFYIIGGLDDDWVDFGPLNATFRYDIDTEDWVVLAPAPIALFGASALCYEGNIYLAGGVGSDNYARSSFYIYNIATDTWSFDTVMPRTVYAAAIGVWDGIIYLVGGTDEGWGQGMTPVNQVDVYDIATHTWIPDALPHMPTAASNPGYDQAGPYLYLVGGHSGNYNFNVTATQRLNLASWQWDTGPIFSSARAVATTVVTEHHLYAIGGENNGGGWLDSSDLVELLDLSDWPNGFWQDLNDPLPTPSQGNVSNICTDLISGGEIWSVGGVDATEVGWDFQDTNLYYPVGGPCVHFGVDLPEPIQGEGAAGETVLYTLSITNTGVVTDYFSLDIDTSWSPGLPLGGPVKIGPGQTIQIMTGVEVPADAMWGDFGLTEITAASISNPAEFDATTITTRVLGYQVDVQAHPSDSQQGHPGGVLTYTLQVTNAGDFVDSYTVTISATWGTISPISVVPLLPGDDVEMLVTVEIPQEAMHGDWDYAETIITSQADPRVSKAVKLTSTAFWHRMLMPLAIRN